MCTLMLFPILLPRTKGVLCVFFSKLRFPFGLTRYVGFYQPHLLLEIKRVLIGYTLLFTIMYSLENKVNVCFSNKAKLASFLQNLQCWTKFTSKGVPKVPIPSRPDLQGVKTKPTRTVLTFCSELGTAQPQLLSNYIHYL